MTPLCAAIDVTTFFPALSGVPYLDTLIGVASRMIYAFTGRERLLKATGIVEDVDGSGRTHLSLSHFPIVGTPTVVYEDGSSVTDFDVVAGGMLYRQGYWTDGVKNYRVTYDAGYEASEHPSITHAAVLLVKHLYDQNSVALPTGVRRRALADSEIEYFENPDAELPPTIRLLLEPYRRVYE